MDIRFIALAFVIGIYLTDKVGIVNVLLFVFGVFLVCIVKPVFKGRITLMLPVAAASLAAGSVMYAFSASEEVNKSYDFISRDVTVTGRVCSVPHKDEDITKYIVDVRYISDGTEEISAKERIMIYYDGDFSYGDTVSFRGVLKQLPKKLNENGFDAEKYYRRRGIASRMNAEIAFIPDYEIRDRSPQAFVGYIRYSIDKLINKYYSGDRAAVMKAVLTGNKHEFSEETNELLIRTSTKGMFYPVYIHMLLINLLIGCISSIVNKRKRDIITALVLTVYMLLNTEHATFVRRFSFAAAAVVSGRFFKKVYYPDVFSAAVLVNAVMNPLMMFDPCYISSASSAVFMKIFYHYIMEKFKLKNAGWITRTVIINIICTVGILPVTAYFFNSISIYCIIASILSLPAVLGMLCVSPLFLGMMYFFGKAPVAGQFMTSMTSIMLAVPKLIDGLPFSRIYVQSPTLIFISAYIVLVSAGAYAVKKKFAQAKRFLAVSSAMFFICGVCSASGMNTIEIDFVNVGQGDGAVIKVPFGANLLIDGGGSDEYSDYDVGAKVYLPYLVSRGVTSVDAAFVSHYHKDHIQGIAAAIANLRVKNLFLPDNEVQNEWRTLLEETAKENGTKLHYIKNNTKIKFNDGLCVDITVPDLETRMSSDENDTSLLINVSYGEFNCLFTGDMTQTAEKNLLRKGKVPEAEVLKIAHHGSAKSTCSEFFETVSPVYSIISVGEDNIYHLPSDTLMERIKDSFIMRTDICGDIRIISDKKGNIKIHTFK